MSSGVFKKALKAFKNIDIFSAPVQLLIKHEAGHKTLFGAGLTIVLIVFFSFLLIFNLYSLSQRNEPTSLASQNYHTSPNYYSYDSSNFTLTFSLQSADFATYIDESIYVVDATLVQKTSILVDGKYIENWNSRQLPLTTCSVDLIRQTELLEYFSHLNLPTNLCIDWDKIDKVELEGTFDAKIYTYILIQIKMCTESTKKSKECKSKEEIVQALQNNYFSLQLSSLVVDVKNPYSPFTSIGQDIFTTISSKIFKELAIYLEPATVLTDFNLISENYEVQKSLRFKKNTEMLDLNESELLMNIAIRLDQTEQLYYRSYPKIQKIFAELGGLWNVFFTLILMLQKPINRLSYYLQIINSLFEFEQEQDIHNNILIESEERKELPNKFGSSPRVCLMDDRYQRAFQRLKSISMKKQQLDSLDRIGHQTEVNLEAKIQLSKAISSSIKQYFRSIEKKLQINWTNYLYFMKCFKESKNSKNKQIDFSVKKAKKQMDIVYIMKKLQEIDKLKMILLTDTQLKVFDYLQKPKIPTYPESREFNQSQQYFSILKPIKSDYQRAADAQAAFRDLAENIDNPINLKLINSIDQRIVELLQLRRQSECVSMEEISINQEAQEIQQVFNINIKKNNIQ